MGDVKIAKENIIIHGMKRIRIMSENTIKVISGK